ncbi:extracellular solute-binding protein [Paenibacillus sp. GCM10027626]|uniref:extracellular solute-binding protein n=1 Tax=Paenibacillus sp. GCM10027626 TaxID=3273411 RepID=UPI00363A8723
MRNKSIITKFMVVLAIAGLMAGCGSTGDGNGLTAGAGEGVQEKKPENNAGGKNKNDAGKPIKIEVIEPGNGLPSPDQDIIKQELDKALGIEMNLTVYASGDDYRNQLNVRMASANFPDLFRLDRQQMKQFSEQGLLLDLTPYLDKLKPTIDFIGEESLKKGTMNGKVYAIAKSPQIPYNTFWIRKDWLDRLQLDVPKNLDELLAVAKAFTTGDPDGNGKKDTFGLTGAGIQTFNTVFGAFGIGFDGGPVIYMKDGKMVNSLYDPSMKDALAYIKEMIAAGVVDPEIMANTGLQHHEKAIKGQSGIIYIDWPNMTKEQFVEQIKAVNPNAEWIPVKAVEGPGGAYASAWDVGMTPGLNALPKSLEKDPEKLDKMIELLNYVSTEGANLVQYGVEGSHFNMEGGKVVPTELLSKEGAYFWLYQFTGRPEMEYLQVKFAKQKEFIEFADNEPRVDSYGGFIDPPDGFNSADASRYIGEELTKFIYGKRPIEQYDDFLKTLESSMNYRVFLDSAEQQLKALGYIQ